MYKINFVNHSKNYASMMKKFQNCHNFYNVSIELLFLYKINIFTLWNMFNDVGIFQFTKLKKNNF